MRTLRVLFLTVSLILFALTLAGPFINPAFPPYRVGLGQWASVFAISFICALIAAATLAWSLVAGNKPYRLSTWLVLPFLLTGLCLGLMMTGLGLLWYKPSSYTFNMKRLSDAKEERDATQQWAKAIIASHKIGRLPREDYDRAKRTIVDAEELFGKRSETYQHGIRYAWHSFFVLVLGGLILLASFLGLALWWLIRRLVPPNQIIPKAIPVKRTD